MGLSCVSDDVVQTLQRALFKRQLFNDLNKPVIRTDNGPQFISHTFEKRCEEFELEHGRVPPQTCIDIPFSSSRENWNMKEYHHKRQI